MTVYDLNRDQLVELKQRYMTEEMAEHNEFPSYADLAEADDIYSDEYIQAIYSGTEFVDDDFFSSAGQEEEKLSDTLERLRDDVLAVSTAGYIPFVSPYPSSTEKDLKEAVYKAYMWLDRAQDLAKSLRY